MYALLRRVLPYYHWVFNIFAPPSWCPFRILLLLLPPWTDMWRKYLVLCVD